MKRMQGYLADTKMPLAYSGAMPGALWWSYGGGPIFNERGSPVPHPAAATPQTSPEDDVLLKWITGRGTGPPKIPPV